MKVMDLEQELVLPRLRVRVWSPAPAVFCSEVSGHFSVDGLAPLIDRYQDLVARDPAVRVKTFHDWAGATSYDSEARLRYTEQAAGLTRSIDFIEALVSSRIVAMGVEVAKIILRMPFHATTDRAEFERRRADVIAASLAS